MRKKILRVKNEKDCRYADNIKCLHTKECFGCEIIDAIVKENEILREKLSTF